MNFRIREADQLLDMRETIVDDDSAIGKEETAVSIFGIDEIRNVIDHRLEPFVSLGQRQILSPKQFELFTETHVITVWIYDHRLRRFTRLLRHQYSLTWPADNSGNRLCNSEKTCSNLAIINKGLKPRCNNSESRVDGHGE
ncbi:MULTISPECIES: hypothetical protein [Rhizobium]|uniref:hypothetical protein n=1 Tax=Rhizobium TaxID=379 RepID=UPI001FDA5AAA|nr:hypothetical protein [Rhizobium miluonense]